MSAEPAARPALSASPTRHPLAIAGAVVLALCGPVGVLIAIALAIGDPPRRRLWLLALTFAALVTLVAVIGLGPGSPSSSATQVRATS